MNGRQWFSLIARIKEPSTWAGIAAIAAALGVQQEAEAIGSAVAAVAGCIAVILPEGGGQ